MTERLRKTLSITVLFCIFTSLFAGCDFVKGKATKQQELVENYLNACIKFDYHEAAGFVEKRHDSFSDVVLSFPQSDIVELVLSKAVFEVTEIENDRAAVNFIIPDIDRALRRELVAALSVEEIEDILNDSPLTITEVLEFDFIREGREWKIDSLSTADFAEYVSAIGVDVAEEIRIGLGAQNYFDAVMSTVASGDLSALMSLLYGNDPGAPGGSGFHGVNVNDLIAEFFSANYGSAEYETEIIAFSEDEVTLQVSGTILDFPGAYEQTVTTNHDLTVNFLKTIISIVTDFERIDYDVDSEEYDSLYYDYFEAKIDFYLECLAEADRTTFTIVIPISIDEQGNYSMDLYYIEAMQGQILNPGFPTEFYIDALEELLEEEVITEDEFYDYLATSPSYFMNVF